MTAEEERQKIRERLKILGIDKAYAGDVTIVTAPGVRLRGNGQTEYVTMASFKSTNKNWTTWMINKFADINL